MRNKKDLRRAKQCINFLRLKAIDYNLPTKDFPTEFLDKLSKRISLYGEHLEALDKHLRDTMYSSLTANRCSIKDDTAIVALEIIKKNCQEFMELTDTYPNMILRMDAKQLFELVSEFEEDDRNIRIAAYALGQYKITASSSTREVKEPLEFEDIEDDDEDWIDLEEEEDDED